MFRLLLLRAEHTLDTYKIFQEFACNLYFFLRKFHTLQRCDSTYADRPHTTIGVTPPFPIPPLLSGETNYARALLRKANTVYRHIIIHQRQYIDMHTHCIVASLIPIVHFVSIAQQFYAIWTLYTTACFNTLYCSATYCPCLI